MLTCTFEDGGVGNMRHVVMDVIVLKDNQVLLNKRAAHLLNGGKWGLLGGYMDVNETTREGAAREVFEESGWRVTNLQLLRIIDWPNRRGEDRQNVSFVFFGEAVKQEGTKDSEVDELRWFDLDQLPAPEDIAFDHLESIQIYLQYRQQPQLLPIFGTADTTKS